jgi:hypothetical protein
MMIEDVVKKSKSKRMSLFEVILFMRERKNMTINLINIIDTKGMDPIIYTTNIHLEYKQDGVQVHV